MSERPKKSDETLLSYLLKNAPHDGFSTDASPQTLHPFASSSPDDPLSLLKNLVDASRVLDRTLHSYSSLSASDHKFVSILRQSTTLVHSLHTVSKTAGHIVFVVYQRTLIPLFPSQSREDARGRIDALKARDRAGAVAVYGEPIPLDSDLIVDWCVSRIEDWGKKNGMEVFKDEEDRNGKMTIMLGGKVLVVDVDLDVQRGAPNSPASHITVSSIKTSHALPSGSSGNALAERSASLDAFILQTWNDYLEEVQKNDVESSMRAAHISRDIQSHLAFLMKLDALASQEGDQGIRWFNDTGLMSAVADRISKTEVDSLSIMLQSPVVNLDVFLSRAHALALPYLVSPSMCFLVFLSPLAYYSLLRGLGRNHSNSQARRLDTTDAFTKLDIPLFVLREQLTQRRLRPPGTVIATLTLTSISSLLSPDRRPEQRPNLGRPHFRLPGASVLAALDHTLIAPSSAPTKDSESKLKSVRDVWMLDFTDGGHSGGIVMTHSRMREVQQVIDPASTGGGIGFTLQMQMPPLPGSWIGLLINPALPLSERYVAVYKSPSNAHPPLRLCLTVPNEAGFLLQRVPVNSLKEAYGILEIVQDQCWINETLKSVEWVAEDLMPDTEDDGDDMDAAGAPEEELEALLKGTYTPRRIPVNVFLPMHPPSFPTSSNTDAADGLGLDGEHAVPGLASVSMAISGNTPSPCIALAFAVHESGPTDFGQESGSAYGPRQVALVLRHDRTRRRGVRVDVNVSAASDMGYGDAASERPSAGLTEELEESVRRGGAFGTAGKVWAWLSGKEK